MCIRDRYGSFYGAPWGAQVNYVMSGVLLVCMVISPFFIIGFYLNNFKRLADSEFVDKWGAPYDGLYVYNKGILGYPVMFVIRRVVFAVLSLFASNFLIGQLGAQIYLTFI